jgi:hypothetical protein
MKTFIAASVIALASVATAQLDNIPSCAVRIDWLHIGTNKANTL